MSVSTLADERKGSALSRNQLLGEINRLRKLCETAGHEAERSAIMLREGDHRIKNSLQILAGLLDTQARREQAEQSRSALIAAAGRIQAIASVHDALQANQGSSSVDLSASIKDLCNGLQTMVGEAYVIEVSAPDATRASIAAAQPILLVIAELVVNAVRHAFKAGRIGTVRVTLRTLDGRVEVSVADNGRGLPEKYAEGKGYGLRLVRMMATQLDADLRAESDDGARFTLSLPEEVMAVSDASKSTAK